MGGGRDEREKRGEAGNKPQAQKELCIAHSDKRKLNHTALASLPRVIFIILTASQMTQKASIWLLKHEPFFRKYLILTSY